MLNEQSLSLRVFQETSKQTLELKHCSGLVLLNSSSQERNVLWLDDSRKIALLHPPENNFRAMNAAYTCIWKYCEENHS